jgi:hypothetical protein
MLISLPYLDQPKAFWRDAVDRLGDRLHEVYFPLPRDVFGSGRPVLPHEHLLDFLEADDVPKAVLLNAVTLDEPYAATVDRLWPFLERLTSSFRIDGATVQDPRLLEDLSRSFPALLRCASTLMEIAAPVDLAPVIGFADVVTPASWVVRDYATLATLRSAFDGRIKLLVNEGCLVRCPWRRAHFTQMNSSMAEPPTLCGDALEKQPWLRLTGAWILPQHLHLLDGLFDIVKIAGRGTIHTADDWLDIAHAYLDRTPLTPDRIGVGPSGPDRGWTIETGFYEATQHCDKRCETCTVCSQEYDRVFRDELGA